MNKAASPLEVDCIRRLQQNDDLALAMLMKIFYNDLFNYASRICTDAPLIKDCIQEVFISLWQRRSTVLTILSPRYYLLRAVKNKLLKALHHQNRHTSLNMQEVQYVFSEELTVEWLMVDKHVSEEKANKLRDTYALLSQRQKEVIYLKYYQHLDNDQIAGLMNIGRQSVYNLVHETIQKLRAILVSDYMFK